jgi:hypothetical protein
MHLARHERGKEKLSKKLCNFSRGLLVVPHKMGGAIAKAKKISPKK